MRRSINAAGLSWHLRNPCRKLYVTPAVYGALSRADPGTFRVGMSQKNKCVRINPSLVASCAMAVRPRAGVRPDWLLASLSLLHLHRYTAPVRPRSPVARYTVPSRQGCVDFVKSISTGLRLHHVLILRADIRPAQASVFPQVLGSRLPQPRLLYPGRDEQKGNRNLLGGMSERGSSSFPVWRTLAVQAAIRRRPVITAWRAQ